MRKDSYIEKKENVTRGYRLIDAKGQVLGRLATTVANLLRGKDKPTYTPHVDCGDHVIVVNASSVVLTGQKKANKMYHHYSGYRGGMKSKPAEKVLQTKPESMIELAVWGMLPKNRLSRHIIKKLKVYAGESHPHEAQKPQEMKI